MAEPGATGRRDGLGGAVSVSNHALLSVLCPVFMAVPLGVDEDVPVAGSAGGAGERPRRSQRH